MEEGGWSDGDEDVFIGYANLVFALGGYHPERTSRGTHVPYLKKDGLTFGFLNLNPEVLPPSCPAGEYWPRMGTSVMPRWVGEMVGAADAPVNTREDRQFPQADDVERTLDQADKLLNAAQSDKRRVIPTGAVVQLPFGAFRSFELHEVGDEVGFVARTHRGEFSLGYLRGDTGSRWNVWWPCPLLLDLKKETARSGQSPCDRRSDAPSGGGRSRFLDIGGTNAGASLCGSEPQEGSGPPGPPDSRRLAAHRVPSAGRLRRPTQR